MPSNKRKTEFWWASIAGSDCEPVEIATLNGERVAYTCGCGDPFYLDRPDCPVLLVAARGTDGAMDRQPTPKQEEEALKKYRRRMARGHSWRGPR